MTGEMVWQALAKIQIALGLDVRRKEYCNHPDFERALYALKELKSQMDEGCHALPVETLGLDAKICGYLRESDIVTIGQLVEMTDAEMLEVPQIQAGRLAAIDAALRRSGFQRVRSERPQDSQLSPTTTDGTKRDQTDHRQLAFIGKMPIQTAN